MSPPERPILGVSTLIWRDGRVLLVRRGRPPFENVWALPGGRVEPGEPLATTARREVREETSLDIEVGEQVDTAEIIGKDPAGRLEMHYVLIVFAGRFLSGDPVAGGDAAETRWVARNELGSLPMTVDTARIVSRGPQGHKD